MVALSAQQDSQRRRRVDLAGARVLVAEDNLVNREVAGFHLEDLGCIPVAAENGAIALERAKAETFDFILMDCQMPVMDGFAALAAMRALGGDKAAIPILAVTAADDAQSQQDCHRAGFDGFLAKPFSAEQLRAALLSEKTGFAALHAPAVSVSDEIIDRGTFTSFVNDFGAETAAQLLQSYIKLLADSRLRFEVCVANGDLADLQALSHKLAGGSGMVGARKLGVLAKALDARGKKKKLVLDEEAQSLLHVLTATHEQLMPLADVTHMQSFIDRT